MIAFQNDRLRELRRRAGLTQKAFGEKIDCTMASVSAYENGSKLPPTRTLMNIADTFKCSIDWLMGMKNEMNYDATSGSIKTYSDYIKNLFNLHTAEVGLFVGMTCFDEEKTNPSLTLEELLETHSTCIGLGFYDPVIRLFIESWKKTRSLYRSGIIDDTLYEGWKEKVLRDFKHNILADDYSWMDFERLYSIYSSRSEWTGYEALLEALQNASRPISCEPDDAAQLGEGDEEKSHDIDKGNNQGSPS